MLKILGEHYFLDLDAIEDYINIEPPMINSGVAENHISVVKYEMVKMLSDTILTENDDLDETLGAKTSGLSLPFKIAFNSLLNKKLINKY
jgi:hypothetical protein